jgi:bifunctional DNA-binding transcriptional regulator/antitoxin component of YhaV-PrlF toxin-antitoxin module
MAFDKPSFITECSEDEEGNLVLNFPDELLEAMGWGEGTTLDISVVGDRIVLQEVRETDSKQDSAAS